MGAASCQAEVIGLFDADIRTFRLLSPVDVAVDGSLQRGGLRQGLLQPPGIETRALQGRATRLFVAPLLASLEQLVGPVTTCATYGLGYPLAGEFAFTTDLVMHLRIPSDWGWRWDCFEVYRHVALSRIAHGSGLV